MMSNETSPNDERRQGAECRVCGDLILLGTSRLQDKNEFQFCTLPFCQRVASQRPKMRPEVFAHHLAAQRKISDGRRAQQAANKQRVADLEAEERRENQRILGQVLSQRPELSQEDLDLLQLPSGRSTTSRLTDDRIKKYTEHLRKTISEAAGYRDVSQVQTDRNARKAVLDNDNRFSDEPELQVLSDRLCGMCKGGCCTVGGDTAYITACTIRRYMDEHPELSEEEILAAYLSRISFETVTSACINQTNAGCVLPREMRSDTCNGFYCDTLKS